MDQRFRITASVIAKYFRHRCDRQFRWSTVDASDRGRPGIGWGVPRRVKQNIRSGVALLIESGDTFELENIAEIESRVGREGLRREEICSENGRKVVAPLPFAKLAMELREGSHPQYVAQIELTFTPEQERLLLERFQLHPSLVMLGTARPDLIEIRPPNGDGRLQLRVWDFKGSSVARQEHFIQVAYYTVLLEQAVESYGLAEKFAVDTMYGVIQSRDGDDEFELAPYRLAINQFLRDHLPALLSTTAADSHYHVTDGCFMCDYSDHCRAESDAGHDLSRIAYMTTESKRRLRAAGIPNQPALARPLDKPMIARLHDSGHDLSRNINRYMLAARAIEDGVPRQIAESTLLMPAYDDVRVVLSAEQDPVTGTCFALGLKVRERFNQETQRYEGSERIFIAESPDNEARMLLDFLQHLNELMQRIDAENRNIDKEYDLDKDPLVAAAHDAYQKSQYQLSNFKDTHGRLYKKRADHAPLLEERDKLETCGKDASKAISKAKKDAEKLLRSRKRKLHFYIYDQFDLTSLQRLIERHIFTTDLPELLGAIADLVRLFPPDAVLPDADTFRSMPGTVLTNVLRNLVALPVPYTYDLKTVSNYFAIDDKDGKKGYSFNPRFGFARDYSNQIVFERIHDVWNNKDFNPDPRNSSRDMTPNQIYKGIEETISRKLRATDSIVQQLQQNYRDALRLYKAPFYLFRAFDPIEAPSVDALRVFTILESSLQELEVKHRHMLPSGDRVAAFRCVTGLNFEHEADDNSFWFTFDPECRDVRFDIGDFNLVVTPADDQRVLTRDVDGRLFDRSWSTKYQVSLIDLDLTTDLPRLCLIPKNPAQFREAIDLSKTLVLDDVYIDYNSDKILKTIESLRLYPDALGHVHELLASGGGTVVPYMAASVEAIEQALRERIVAAGDNPDRILNAGQWRALRGVFAEPATLIWGPPGTGKTHTLAFVLLACLGVAQQGRALRVLVTAVTHQAIINLLEKLVEVATHYGVTNEELAIYRIAGQSEATGDVAMEQRVEPLAAESVPAALAGDSCVVIGATVWGTYKAMKAAIGNVPAPPQAWFDVVLIDEASQMRLPDALLAFVVARNDGAIILAGDDMQLPPIIHGNYPTKHDDILGSAFSFLRSRVDARTQEDPTFEARRLFHLEENFRMNEPLTGYPRDILYRGRFMAMRPTIKISLQENRVRSDSDPIDAMLNPERPVVLCHYESPHPYTARNPIEVELAAALVERLSRTLIDNTTGKLFTPEAFSERAIAVLAPHRAQNSAIRSALAAMGFGTSERPMPLVDTVEKLQGKERDVVIVSYAVADQEYVSAEAEFLLSRNRFNVAITRARHKLVVLCSDAVLTFIPQDRDVLLESMMLKEFNSYCADGQITLPWEGVELEIVWRGFV